MREDLIQCVKIPAIGPARVGYLPNELEAFQMFVGGPLEAVTLPNDALLLCDEEAWLKGVFKPAENQSVCLRYCPILGNAVIVAVAGEEFASLNDDDAERIQQMCMTNYRNYYTDAHMITAEEMLMDEGDEEEDE